jgi:lipid II:glycine glycyltransferase (peptidoglycan interpeptide bridge formation enzyme)
MSSKMRPLRPEYVAEFDNITETAWCELLKQFNDASVYQTWTYDEVRSGRKNISHLVLKKNGTIVAIAQARLMRIPLLGAGVAYIRWAPMWRSRTRPNDVEDFRQAVRALRNEYACKRGLVLRLYPNLFRQPDSTAAMILAEEGFAWLIETRPDRTLRFDITRPLEDIRKTMRQHWRRSLKSAEKAPLEIVEGTDDILFDQFVTMYREMLSRKKFVEPNDIEQFRAIQRRLPDELKMRIMICKLNDVPCAGIICSAVGESAIYLFGATSNAGLKSFGSYALHWRMIGWLKQQNVAIYDLNGINPETNPGTYKFKSDLCGEAGEDVIFMGRFDTCTSVVSQSIVSTGDRLRLMLKNLKYKLAAQEKPEPKAAPENTPATPQESPVAQ